MRKIILMMATLFLPIALANAQTNIQMRGTENVDNEDLMNVLRFQGISINKLTFSGTDLWGKEFKIFIRDFTNGKLVKIEEIFDSREDEFFKIKEQEFSFNVLAQRTNMGTAKIDFRFLGFGVTKEFKLTKDQNDFMLKRVDTALGERQFTLGKNHTILAYLMPYKSKNGVSHYPALSDTDLTLEELGKKLKIPRYFLIDIRFDKGA